MVVIFHCTASLHHDLQYIVYDDIVYYTVYAEEKMLKHKWIRTQSF